MTYAVSSALQQALYQRISTDAATVALIGSDIFDEAPAGTPPATYVTLGPESVKDSSDMTGRGATHDLTISVVTSDPGFQSIKDIAAAISDALVDPLPTLSRGILVSLFFVKAKAVRDDGDALRRVELSFRALVQDS